MEPEGIGMKQRAEQPPTAGGITLRKAIIDQDCDSLRRIFHDAVMASSASHYNLPQRIAWAQWATHPILVRRVLAEGLTLVAEIAGEAAGFAQLNPTSYVRMLYVAPEYGRQGIAELMLRALEQAARKGGVVRMETHASLTSRPVFARAGYHLEGPAPTERNGIVLERFLMAKRLKAQ